MLGNIIELIIKATTSKSSSELEELYNVDDSTLKTLVLKNKNISSEALEKIFNSGDIHTKIQVIKNPNSPKYLIERLSDEERELLEFKK